jgi:inverted formin-2
MHFSLFFLLFELAPAPPPPPAPSINNKVPIPPACPPPPPIDSLNLNHEVSRPKTPNQIEQLRSLPQQETPIPRSKMKTINWNKIPQNKIVGKVSENLMKF